MKILVLTHNYPSVSKPAEGVFLHRIYKEIKNKVEIQVILLKPSFGMPKIRSLYSYDGISVYELNYFRPRGRIFNSLDGIFAISTWSILCKLINKHDVIHGHWQVETGPLCMLLSKFKGLPFIISVRGGNIFSKGKITLYSIFSKLIFNNADLVHSHGKNNIKFLNKQYNVPKSKLIFIPNIIFSERNIKKSFAKKVSHKKNTSILFVGIDNKRKGLLDAVLAFNKMDKKTNLHFNIITNDCTKHYLKCIKGIISNNKQITVHSPVKPNHMDSFFRNAKVFLFPSYNEGVPNAVIEAMMMGCNIICYDIPGIRGIIRHRINGRLVKVGDINGLVKELEWYLTDNNSQEVYQYQEYNKKFIERYYNTNKIKISYLKMYSNLYANS